MSVGTLWLHPFDHGSYLLPSKFMCVGWGVVFCTSGCCCLVWMLCSCDWFICRLRFVVDRFAVYLVICLIRSRHHSSSDALVMHELVVFWVSLANRHISVIIFRTCVCTLFWIWRVSATFDHLGTSFCHVSVLSLFLQLRCCILFCSHLLGWSDWIMLCVGGCIQI